MAGGWYRHRTDEVWREVVTSPLTHTALTQTDSSHQALEQRQPHHSIPVTSHPGREGLIVAASKYLGGKHFYSGDNRQAGWVVNVGIT